MHVPPHPFRLQSDGQCKRSSCSCGLEGAREWRRRTHPEEFPAGRTERPSASALLRAQPRRCAPEWWKPEPRRCDRKSGRAVRAREACGHSAPHPAFAESPSRCRTAAKRLCPALPPSRQKRSRKQPCCAWRKFQRSATPLRRCRYGASWATYLRARKRERPNECAQRMQKASFAHLHVFLEQHLRLDFKQDRVGDVSGNKAHFTGAARDGCGQRGLRKVKRQLA